MQVVSGGTVSGTVTFSGGGELVLQDSVQFGGLVAGFGVPDSLDLLDIPYVASGASATTSGWVQLTSGANASGTLTVSEGGHVANITLLGQYVTSNFVISSGGATGTMVTDPPLMPTDSATVLVNLRHG